MKNIQVKLIKLIKTNGQINQSLVALRVSVMILMILSILAGHAQDGKIEFKIQEKTRLLEIKKQFIATVELLDAAINSSNSLSSLIKKENYRNKISSFNNPTSSELGFSLELEIQKALKPILAKTRSVSTSKFSNIVSSLISNPLNSQISKVAFGPGAAFNTLISLVATLTVQEKRVTQQDLDSFILLLRRYFLQYEKLGTANQSFDHNVEKLNLKIQEIEFDIKEYIFDIINILHKQVPRGILKQKTMEELLLKYLDKQILDTLFSFDNEITLFHYASDGIKTAKEISYALQKLFNEYQRIYTENYGEIKNILLESKGLGKSIDLRQVDNSLKELEILYSNSKNADVLNLRLNTLFERLKYLVNTESNK